ncbi:GHKL domain-containing protein [Sporosarcina aquimarina]|uniref:sensor histidine kinase n=1 Tax=Sporosarcina aquimarina TaxID=114975 RepID=UPI00203AD634|nr:GHKL domain-containing protein [Sporosarcina aquimarina]MCM3757182.1 GHKL domain-containing protein [Sporosarcina aquimarina]
MNIISGIFLTITVFTGLFLAQSAVGIHPLKSIQKVILSIVIATIVFEALQFLTGRELNSGIVSILLLPGLVWFVRMPFLQAVFTILLGWTYQIAIVYVLQRNLFELAIMQAKLEADSFIIFMMELFILMNNLLIILFVVRLKPILLPAEVFRKTETTDKPKLVHHTTLLASAVLLIVMGIFFQYTYNERQFFTPAYRLFLTGWSLLLLAILVVYLKTSLRQKLAQEKFYLDQQYQQDMLSFFTVIRSQRHDFTFHLTSIYGLLKKNEYDEASSYIGQVVQQVQDVNELLPLAHPAMSALLNTQGELAKQKGIEIHYSIFDDLRGIPVSVYDVNKILGNLIQNAMEELELLPAIERKLHVEITKEKRHYVIRIRNRTTADHQRIMSMFQSGFSTKSSHEGIGLAGVEKIVTANFGVIFPELSEEWLTIHVRIPEDTENY